MAATQTLRACNTSLPIGQPQLRSVGQVRASLTTSFLPKLHVTPLAASQLRKPESSCRRRSAPTCSVRPDSSNKEQLRCNAIGLLTPEPYVEERNTFLEDVQDTVLGAPAAASNWIKSKISPRVRGLALLNLLTFLYGSNLSVIKEGQLALDAFSFSIGRFAIAALAFAPFLRKALDRPAVRRAGLELGVWASAGYVAQAVGLQTTEAGRAAFIGTFTVIEVPLIAGLVFGAKIPYITWVSAAAAVAGVALLETGASDSSLLGEIWTIASALLFGIHMLRSEHHTRHVEPTDAIPLISLQLSVTAVLSIAWMLLLNFSGVPIPGLNTVLACDWSAIQAWPWWQMAYTGVLSTAFCLWVEVVALRDVTAAEAAMVYTLEPLWGAAFAWVLLNERWGPVGWVGAALILVGSLTMQLFGKMEEPEKEGDDGSPLPLVSALGVAATMALLMALTADVDEAVASQMLLPEGRMGGEENAVEMVLEAKQVAQVL
ncbi:unnamed protein product [Closterium sp. Naga37s-1]|nr:unnamed protein product [Closterium sp. Naga37s-1]CAI5501790.1 unnamed protein product [Closterium sp. Naga37s-1]